MKNIFLLGILITITLACAHQQEPTLDQVIKKFYENSDRIENIEFSAHTIDTFASGSVWNKTGFAIVEKDNRDEIFGFSFYGKRDDFPKEHIYHNGQFFEISNADSTYETSMGHFGVLGKPGGQMIPQNILHLDSTYSSISFTTNDKNYIIKYEFDDDSVYNVKNIVKIVEIAKDNFLPWRITRTSTVLGNRTYSQITLSNIKINNEVQNSIKDILNKISNYELIQSPKREANKLLFNKMPTIRLAKLADQNEVVELHIEKLTLIDFWEVWCGPCKASLPKVQNMQNKYGHDLEVVGIVSYDKESAIQILEEKELTFLNLVGNRDLEKKFSVDSWPRYFLVDKNGIVLKEYFGFSEQISLDINQILEK